MEFTKFIEGVDRMYAAYKGEWRWGQCLFNGLAHFRPDLSEQLRATELDPFHHEKNELPSEFWDWLATHW